MSGTGRWEGGTNVCGSCMGERWVEGATCAACGGSGVIDCDHTEQADVCGKCGARRVDLLAQ